MIIEPDFFKGFEIKTTTYSLKCEPVIRCSETSDPILNIVYGSGLITLVKPNHYNPSKIADKICKVMEKINIEFSSYHVQINNSTELDFSIQFNTNADVEKHMNLILKQKLLKCLGKI